MKVKHLEFWIKIFGLVSLEKIMHTLRTNSTPHYGNLINQLKNDGQLFTINMDMVNKNTVPAIASQNDGLQYNFLNDHWTFRFVSVF